MFNRTPPLLRVLARAQTTPTGCWQWTGSLAGCGYGALSINGVSRKAHRVAYECLVGEIPAGLEIDHLCRNRGCVNPKHLEPVTKRENILRGVGRGAKQARQTHCVRGHALTEENIRRDGRRRYCLPCGRVRDAIKQRKRIEARLEMIDGSADHHR